MAFQDLNRRAERAHTTTPSVVEDPVTAPPQDHNFRERLRSRIVRGVSNAGPSNDTPRDAADFKREELIAHAVRVVDGWTKQLQALDQRSPEYRALADKRDLVTRSLIAADVYSDGSKTERFLPSHIFRLEGDSIQFLLGSDFDARQLKSFGSGYSAALYLDKSSNTIIVANRGSGDLADWVNNSRQAMGLKARQYEQAIALAHNVTDAVEKHYGSTVAVEFVGHSLGGGLASAQAVVLQGCRAVTFNAAGLHKDTVERFNTRLTELSAKHITAIQVQGELLTSIQGNMSDIFKGTVMPEAAGISREIGPRQGIPVGRPVLATAEALERHMMHKVLYEMLRAYGGLE
jgi:hypothetical protein